MNWDEYIRHQQSTPLQTPSEDGGALFGALFGGLSPKKTTSKLPGHVGADQMPVGPATPINYGAIRSLLNSGVLRGGTPAVAPPVDPVTADPAPQQRERNPLQELISGILGGLPFGRG